MSQVRAASDDLAEAHCLRLLINSRPDAIDLIPHRSNLWKELPVFERMAFSEAAA